MFDTAKSSPMRLRPENTRAGSIVLQQHALSPHATFGGKRDPGRFGTNTSRDREETGIFDTAKSSPMRLRSENTRAGSIVLQQHALSPHATFGGKRDPGRFGTNKKRDACPGAGAHPGDDMPLLVQCLNASSSYTEGSTMRRGCGCNERY
jgi:hypothetical protein